MTLGFTGTRQGLTSAQMQAIQSWWITTSEKYESFLHGCAIGADCWMAKFIRNQSRYVHSFGYPSTIKSQVSNDAVLASDGVYEPEMPLVRNRTIVNYSDTLLACPATIGEELRSGTWSTVRYARKAKKHIVIVWPDGAIYQENVKPLDEASK